jgi:GNAT superfamily N-acetyltransferase
LLAGALTWPGADRVSGAFAALHDSASVRFVAVLDARIVAYAHMLTHPAAEGGRAGVYLWVDPAWRDQGIGSALWKAVLDADDAYWLGSSPVLPSVCSLSTSMCPR